MATSKRKSLSVNQKAVDVLTVGDWDLKFTYEHDGTYLTTEIIVDGINKRGSFRAAKNPTNTNFNFNGIEPDMNLIKVVHDELNDIVRGYSIIQE
ncbi:hypothetical protein N180_02710 [Pedobacter antarcticus 4BY]|uniref:Uncharacterized protein n=2 Tax=Pedobacter antarcticus TaxID=34086 RepID=A0A081PKF3_9SPHI|nr:hypothetical protein [Pedobacter antarcticus]KEQ31176.1 hypothetical protein N180_02710 [Pedobacter antarcticus 4BY]SFE54101.1 hypothetical protein SAMN03003324_00832 [Pedobacter antarcticus]